MNKSNVFMFSGQGSQYYHMGQELFARQPVFRSWMLKLNDIVYEITGESVLNKIYDGQKTRHEVFSLIQYTHPAIFMIEYALAQVFIENGIIPDYVLGTSMGEFAAAALAGVMTVEEILKALLEQANSFKTCCPTGGMLAILHDPGLYYEAAVINKNSELASINYNYHFVISGKTEGLKEIERSLKTKKIISQLLPVSYSFHSSLIDSAANRYLDFLKDKFYHKPRIPFVSCIHGRILTQLPNEYFWEVARKPILFPEAVRELEKQSSQNLVYLDMSPGGSLTTFAKRNLTINSRSEVYNVMSPFNQDFQNLNKIIEKLADRTLAEQSSSRERRRNVNKMVTYIFPGQGSQHKGMGGTLFDEFPEIMAKADDILGYSIKEMCLEDPGRQLSKTRYTQPALYIVNVLNYLKTLKETGRKPDYVVGHSLGEYSALFVAGAFDFETGLKLVKMRGELMSQATGGSMAAVLGLNEEKVEDILKENGLAIEIANYNTPTQIVISGSATDIEEASRLFEMENVRYIPLNVSGAFHSRYMADAKQEFEEYLDRFRFSELTIPVISNVHARPYRVGKVKENLAEQITHSVKWTESIRYILGLGEMEFVEIGPGDVLTKLVQSIRAQAEPLVVTEDEEYTGQAVKQRFNVNLNETVAHKSELHEVEQVIETQEADRQSFLGINAFSLGDHVFKKDYNLKFAYLTGAMYRGIASKEMVVKIGKAGMMAFFGTGGLEISQIDKAIQYIQKELSNGEAYGMNLICNPQNPEMEEETVALYLKHKVRNIEAAAFLTITPALVRYRAKGLKLDQHDNIITSNRIIGKISRPEVAAAFLSTAPERIVLKLLAENKITQAEANLLKKVPMADDLCAEADSGGHTDGGVAYALIPAIIKLRDEMMEKYQYVKKIRVGAAGGIGTPEAAAAAFILGADFIVTGSINQCTVEACTSDAVKDLLQQINVQDTDYAPAGDMFELGAKVQVLKKGLFFPARANKLYDLYRQHNSLSEIDQKIKTQIQEKYFKRSFEQVYEDVKKYCSEQDVEKAERNPKHKMALIFRWYFGYSSRLAFSGNEECKVDYQVHCGPALGAFNQWVKGTSLEDWHNRHVDEIGVKIMEAAAELLNHRLKTIIA